MPLYQYLARDKQGQAVKGKIEMPTEAKLLQYLEENNLLPIRFSEFNKRASFSKAKNIFLLGRSVTMRDIIVFTRQFATTVQAGIPVLNALRFLSEETQNTYLQSVISKVTLKVEQGDSLSQALRSFPKVFSELYIEMVASGEASGTLDTVLSNLSTTMEKDYSTFLEIKNALRYPILVLTGLILAVLGITLFVIPRFAQVYRQFNMKLPLPTKIMIGTSNFIIHRGIILIIFSIILITLFSYWKNTARGKIIWGRIKLKIPILGVIFTQVSLLRFCFIFGTLNSVGIPILKALEIVSKTLGNSFLKSRIEGFREGVSEGKALSVMIAKDNFFPKLLSHMIGVGEQTGSTDMVISSLSKYYEIDLKSRVDSLTVTIEPLLTAILAVCVLILALGVFLPMWNMVQIFKGGA